MKKRSILLSWIIAVALFITNIYYFPIVTMASETNSVSSWNCDRDENEEDDVEDEEDDGEDEEDDGDDEWGDDYDEDACYEVDEVTWLSSGENFFPLDEEDLAEARNLPKNKQITYDGEDEMYPALMITLTDGTTLCDAELYDVIELEDNSADIGKHTMTVSFVGYYEENEAVSFTYTVIPNTVKVSSTKASRNKIDLSLKAVGPNPSGIKYQVQYAAKGKKAQTVTVSGKKVSLKKLKSNTKYEIKVRVVKKVKSKNYYSSWSKKVTVKTK